MQQLAHFVNLQVTLCMLIRVITEQYFWSFIFRVLLLLCVLPVFINRVLICTFSSFSTELGLMGIP